jgi:hypothetical protein
VRIPDAHILKVLNVTAEVVRTAAAFLHVSVLLNVIVPHVTNTCVQVLCFSGLVSQYTVISRP